MVPYFLIGILFLSYWSCPAQDFSLDTIEVSTDKTTFLVFDDPFNPQADFIDLGTSDYEAKIEGETVFLKAVNAGSEATSIMIKNGEVFYHGVVQYLLNPSETFLDFRANGDDNLAKKSYDSFTKIEPLTSKDVVNKDSLIQARLSEVMTYKPAFHSLGIAANHLAVAVTNIITDQHATYLKILFHNRSSGGYNIDFISFNYLELGARRGHKKHSSRSNETHPLAKLGPDIINAGNEASLGYALPLFNLPSNGKLLITIREKNGARRIELKLPARSLLSAPVF